ncbi:MAG: hypothetical protein V1911_00660, partial [Candidatus Micrarchaeota archaeon]
MASSREAERAKRREKSPERKGGRQQQPAETYNDFVRNSKELTGAGSAPQRKEDADENWYVKFARRAGKMFKAPDTYKDEKYKGTVDFLGWNLKPNEVNAAPTLGLMIGLVIAIPLIIYLLMSVFVWKTMDMTLMMYGMMGGIMIPVVISFMIQNYPVSAAEKEKMAAMTYIPEIVNYMVMSMKLSPNLEKAVAFAAEHGKGKLAKDLQSLVWDAQTGKYNSMEEGLDVLAYKWGAFS